MLLPAVLLDTLLPAAINTTSIGLIQASWEIFFFFRYTRNGGVTLSDAKDMDGITYSLRFCISYPETLPIERVCLLFFSQLFLFFFFSF